MGVSTELWLALLAVLGGLFALTLRRMSRLVAVTRELERYQRTVADLDTRFGSTIGPLVEHLDEIRRHSGDPNAVAEALPDATDRLRAIVDETSSLRAPAGLVDRTPTLVREAERAIRAVEFVDHGLQGLIAARGPRELEAQTSLKRGALNLRHSREAFGTAVSAIAAVRPADLAAHGGARSRAAAIAGGPGMGGGTGLSAGVPEGGDDGSDPRI